MGAKHKQPHVKTTWDQDTNLLQGIMQNFITLNPNGNWLQFVNSTSLESSFLIVFREQRAGIMCLLAMTNYAILRDIEREVGLLGRKWERYGQHGLNFKIRLLIVLQSK